MVVALRPWLLALAVLGGLVSPSLFAQTERPWQRWFGTSPPAKPPLADPQHLAEVRVEVAWLADPITFPYYLDAISGSQALEIRGFVPNGAVRERALNLARIHSSVPVVDALQEHPSLYVKPSSMVPEQLQKRAQSALREALPKQFSQLRVSANPDGQVLVAGNVSSADEHLAVSLALRRLHGCSSVQNETVFPSGRAVSATPVSNPKAEGPDALKAPKISPLAETDAAAKAIAALQRKIEGICPGKVSIEAKSPGEFRVRLTTRADADVSALANRIYALPEAQQLRLELEFLLTQ